MNTIRNIIRALACGLGALAPAGPAVADPPSVADTMTRLSSAAEEELARSIRELNGLREQVAAEKLPLAQELTRVEEEVGRLRREHERLTRLADEGSLGLASLRAEIKARQDELAYIGNLLDEYVRTFESTINVSEMQRWAGPIERARLATEDASMPLGPRLALHAEFAGESLARLFDAVGGMRFAGVGVDPEGRVTEGEFAIVGPVALFRGADGTAAGVAIPQTDSTQPLIRALDGPLQAGLATLVERGEGLLPLDPSRGGALKALVERASLIRIFEKGGPIMWPLLVASILCLGTVIERLIFLMRERVRRDQRAIDRLFAAVAARDIEGAVRIGRASRFHVARALAYALSHRETSLASALLYAQAQELKRFQRGIPILDTVITLAPLLGLLGTVTGMMTSFSLIGGELGAPGAITGGIAEALIATAFGLGIAITALLPFNFLNARVEEARHELESAATQLELLLQAPGRAAVAALAERVPRDGGARAAPIERPVEIAVVAAAPPAAGSAAESMPRRHQEIERRRRSVPRQVDALDVELGEAGAGTVARREPAEE